MTTALDLSRLADFPSDDQIEKSAVIRGVHDEYRYQLRRVWDYSKPQCVWIMLNPSTADSKINDATIRKCMRFAFLWGYGGITVVNLFAYRSRNPKTVAQLPPQIAIGPDNDFFIMEAAAQARGIVFGWGAVPFATQRARNLTYELARSPALCPPQCLGVTIKGEPRHPLMVAYRTPLELYRRAA